MVADKTGKRFLQLAWDSSESVLGDVLIITRCLLSRNCSYVIVGDWCPHNVDCWGVRVCESGVSDAGAVAEGSKRSETTIKVEQEIAESSIF